MAIDSETKRRSMLGMGLMFLVIAPVPDGTLSSVDRLHIIGFPGTITPGAPGVTTTAIHILSTSPITANHASDSGNNLLINDTLEVQQNLYVGGASNYSRTNASGEKLFFGTAAVTGLKINTVRVTTTYIILSTDDDIFADTDGGAFTVTLPAGVNRKRYRILNAGSSNNNLTLAPNGAELLLGANSNLTLLDGDVLVVTYETTEGWW